MLLYFVGPRFVAQYSGFRFGLDISTGSRHDTRMNIANTWFS